MRILFLLFVLLIPLSAPSFICSPSSLDLKSESVYSTTQDRKAFERLIQSSNSEYEINGSHCCPQLLVDSNEYADKESGGYMISENNVNCKRKGIAVQKCIDSMIINNVVNADKQGIVVYKTRGSSFITNKLSGNGKYSVSGHIKGTSNFYKTLGTEDALKSSSYIVLDK